MYSIIRIIYNVCVKEMCIYIYIHHSCAETLDFEYVYYNIYIYIIYIIDNGNNGL